MHGGSTSRRWLESASCWREFIRDLKGRGLDGSKVKLGIMDGLAGLEKVFQEEFSGAKTQRCQVHVARNVLAKVTKKHKKEVAGENSCYRLLAFISLKMELAWRTAPVGKVNDNLPFFKRIAEKEFTQNC